MLNLTNIHNKNKNKDAIYMVNFIFLATKVTWINAYLVFIHFHYRGQTMIKKNKKTHVKEKHIEGYVYRCRWKKLFLIEKRKLFFML
jgi:sRNA-binding regulator protein Hfq